MTRAQAAPLTATDAPERLRAAARSRLSGALGAVRGVVGSQLRGALEGAGWPPSLEEATSAAGAAWQPGRASAEAAAAAARVAPLSALLEAACASAVAAAVAPHPRFCGWTAAEVAAPLRERLAFHFSGGRPTDCAAERPEWLFAHALRCARAYAPAAAALLPPGAPHPPAAALAAALAEEAAGVLRRSAVPQLLARGAAAGPAWTHLADEAAAFDAALAALAGPDAAAACGAVRVLVEKAEWGARWTAAELEAALRQMDAAADDDADWERAASDDEEETAREAELSAPAAGFRPRCAAAALEVVRAAAARAAQLPHASRQRAFLRDVPAAAAADFVARCSRRARSAASFGELVAPDALARAARCICAAAALRDGLEELGEAPALWALAHAQPRRADDEAAPPPRGGVFADEVAACDAFAEEWAGELAAAVASDFAAAAERYSAALRRGAASPAPLLAAAVDAAAAAMLLLRALLPPLQLARVGCVWVLFMRGSMSVLALTRRIVRTQAPRGC